MKPKRVERCTTHHPGCDCRELRYERMERALKVMMVWAMNDAITPKGVERICREALDCLE